MMPDLSPKYSTGSRQQYDDTILVRDVDGVMLGPQSVEQGLHSIGDLDAVSGPYQPFRTNRNVNIIFVPAHTGIVITYR